MDVGYLNTSEEYSNEPSTTLARAGDHDISFAGNLLVLERRLVLLNESPTRPVILRKGNQSFSVSFTF